MENFSNPLTGFSEELEFGRPELINDCELTSTRDELAFALGQNWALVGWDLQRANTLRDIRTALKRVRGINCKALEVFRRRLALETEKSEINAVTLQPIRKQLDEIRERSRATFLELRAKRQQFENIDRVLTKLDHPDKYLVRALRDEKEADLVQLESKWRNWQISCDSLEFRLEQMNALFAQSQLLDFIKSKRHRLTPLNLATAMAGIPYVAWRQSRRRCLQLPTKPAPSLRYAQFEVLLKACPPPLTKREDACNHLRNYLLGQGCARKVACQELARYWRFLRLAAEFTYPALNADRGQLPFLLLRDFQHQVESQSESDAILAENERLNIGTQENE